MKQQISALVVEVLADVFPVIALRGVDEFAREGGDLDFMVPPGKAVIACSIVANAAYQKGWFLACFRDIDYLAQIILIHPARDGKDYAIKIDFFDGLRWYGIGRDISGIKLFESLFPQSHGELRLAGAAGFFQKVLIVGQLSERDWARVEATGADPFYLARIAQILGLPITRGQIERRGVKGLDKWRLRAASGGVHSLFSGLLWFLSATIAHLRFKLENGAGMGLVIGISGLDGSGKSTLVDRLSAVYVKAGVERPSLVHLLPSWIPMPHQLIGRQKSIKNYTHPYAEPPVSSRLNGLLRLCYYLCAFAVARISFWFKVKRGRLIFMDRGFLDFVSDMTRARIPNFRLPKCLKRILTPHGRLFYLDASPEVVVARKGELTLEKAGALRARYLETCDIVGAKLLDGDNTSDAVFSELLGHLSREYMQRAAVLEARE
ncbi:MAG: hypothetical protein VR64_22870 [Desulfatitalea sp. BRH_c12]|nr:MAG: hypothetical protein VR64_22870 [Desulfatitalea sp. BRH_c12]